MYKMTRNYQNQQRVVFPGAGDFDIPKLWNSHADIEGLRWVPFNYAKNEKHPEECVCHFFIDDYQFERLWARPDDYTRMLSKFAAVCTPDFSMYTDYPKAIQVYNHFRKHWLGAYWQLHDMVVIPTIGWSDIDSYDFCFDGEPIGGVVAISDAGCLKSKEAKKLFDWGYEEMKNRLHPEEIVCYSSNGNVERFGSDNVRVIQNTEIERLKKLEVIA